MGRRGCASAMGMIKFPSSCSSPKALCNQFIDYYICSRGVFCINHIKLRNFVVITIECSIATVDRGNNNNMIYTITIHTQVSLQQVESDSTIHINASNKWIAWIPDGTSCSISTLDYDYMWRKWRWITMTFNRNILKGHCEIQIYHDRNSPKPILHVNSERIETISFTITSSGANCYQSPSPKLSHCFLHKKLLSKHSTAFLSTRIILSSLLFNRMMHTVISVNSLWPGPLC